MLLSRSASILKTACQLNRQKNIAGNLQQVRNKWCYRTVPERSLTWEIAAEVAAGLAWFWVLHSFYYHSEHFLGEFDYPDPKDWTDEELGILPED
ncbi:NADH dehydrogenase (ubiquinone) 1 beta subcomplex, 2, 8kDa [Megachile rotundata]|uniref:NADH dehydrogenase (ubiquinone) 1 beta subcomplex, 2, 8kDa n=1 Tax=Megachile rotundata TaxID=143995 RepID=UPI000258D6A8|nr:PREDICTED: NADH dehydrogenase [ubiquinone] 1 beta subcomplex subunit 2, mitochondrial-like [Megachile rotundata]